MHPALEEVKAALVALAAQIESAVPTDDPLNIAHNQWANVGTTRRELMAYAQDIVDLLDESGAETLDESAESHIRDFPRRITYVQKNTVSQFWGGNSGPAVAAYKLTLDALSKALRPCLTEVRADDVVRHVKLMRTRLRSLHTSVEKVEGQASDLEGKVREINAAYDVASSLPTVLKDLEDAQRDLKRLNEQAKKDAAQIDLLKGKVDDLFSNTLTKQAAEAKSILEKCGGAYSADTSKGLAAAFNERSDALNMSMWVWVIGLVVALGAGGYFGGRNLQTLTELIKTPGIATWAVILNVALSLLAVGAPVWFAWVATKQIGQRFRLSEDYAFKSAVSRAYEGYRREAVEFGEHMEERLFTSALSRFDELPLRVVETTTHGSPVHELLSSDAVRQAARQGSAFTDKVLELAKETIGKKNTTSSASPET